MRFSLRRFVGFNTSSALCRQIPCCFKGIKMLLWNELWGWKKNILDHFTELCFNIDGSVLKHFLTLIFQRPVRHSSTMTHLGLWPWSHRSSAPPPWRHSCHTEMSPVSVCILTPQGGSGWKRSSPADRWQFSRCETLGSCKSCETSAEHWDNVKTCPRIVRVGMDAGMGPLSRLQINWRTACSVRWGKKSDSNKTKLLFLFIYLNFSTILSHKCSGLGM